MRIILPQDSQICPLNNSGYSTKSSTILDDIKQFIHSYKMKHKHLMFRGGSSWHDTDKLALNISVIMLYIVGLLSFQKITGLMDLGKPTEVVKLHPQHIDQTWMCECSMAP